MNGRNPAAMTAPRRNRAFTLIDLLIVVAIIAILATLGAKRP